MIQIDKDFIEEREKEYHEPKIGADEKEYNLILSKVSDEISHTGTLSRKTFEQIADWKSFHVRYKVDWNDFGLYQTAIRYVLEVPDKLKVSLLCGLDGVDVPVASTILHFMYPSKFPIVDYRAAQALRDAGHKLQKRESYLMYNKYRTLIEDIVNQTGYDIRTIDRALFTYHKKTYSPANKE